MERPTHSAAGPLALLYVALIVYASLFPFTGWRDQGIVPWAYLRAPWPRYWTGFDLAVNVVGYAPMGLLLTLARLGAVGRWEQLRADWFGGESRGALVLLSLWPVGLLFPMPVAYGMGQVYERAEEALAEWLMDTPFLDWLPVRDIELQPMLPWAAAASVALGALAPCVLGYTVVAPRARRAVFALAALAVGLAVSALSAALSYGPANAWAWVTPSVQRGLPLAALAAVVLIGLPVRACAGALLAAVLAQLALLNSATPNVYFAATLQSWEQGRFIHFYGLAQWLGWLWPFAVLAWLLARALAHAPVPKIKP